MYFQLRKLILWPRIEAPPRVLTFQPETVDANPDVSLFEE